MKEIHLTRGMVALVDELEAFKAYQKAVIELLSENARASAR
ncbi:hypothetical protein [Sporotomaculum syntrophicum]|nr:hypothetical protein [Sporotomaculum syntrophicum]